MREYKDLSHHTELMALSLAALAGNPTIDAQQASLDINDMIIKALNQKLPYTKSKYESEKTATNENSYDEYFKQLEEFKKELAEKESKNKTAQQDLKAENQDKQDNQNGVVS